MSKKRTKRYLKKLDKALQESNRYLAGIMDLMTWEKLEQERYNESLQHRVVQMSYKEAKRKGLI